MYGYVNNDEERIGELTISLHGEVRYHGMLDIASSRALDQEMFKHLKY